MRLLPYVLLALGFTVAVAVADTKITDLPLGSAAGSGSQSVVPYVDTAVNITKKLKLSDLINVPALAAPNFCTAKPLTGFISSSGAVTSSDTILTAIEKLNGNSTPSAPVSIGTYDSQSAVANGLQIIANVLYAQSADATHPGMVSTGTQSFGGSKSLSIAKILNLTTNGIAYVSSSDGTLNAGTLTGDVTSSALATTLATVNSNVGSFTYGNFTVNAKGLITAASSGTAPVTSLTVATANGFAGSFSASTTPALTLTTSVTGILKGNGTAISAATSGTDYAPATSGSLPLFGNGSGGFTNGSVTGNTTKVATSTGSLSSGNCAKWDASGNVIDAGAACGTGSGTVTTSGTPASGNLTKFSGTTVITNGDLSGDVTTSGTLATTIANLAVTNAKIANSTIDLTAKVTGILPVANGGTGLATLTAHALQVGNGTTATTQVGPSASTAFPLVSGGSSADPAYALLGVAGGGTGLATLTAHAVYVGNGTSAPTALAVGATNTVLHGNTGADPSYSAIVNADITNSTIDLTTKVTGVLPSANVGGGRTINAQTGTTYTFVLADASNAGGSPLVTGSNASAQTFTVPPQSSVVWLAGAQIDVCQVGAGKLTLAQGSGVTISSKSSNKSIGAQNVCVSLVRTASDAWLLIGDLIASVLNLLGFNLYA